MKPLVKFIDLFAGLGGLRLGLEQAAADSGFDARCVFTSEIKPHAIEAYKANFPGEVIAGDITKINVEDIPSFDVLLAGFPCQPFSSAGKGLGFGDTRGTLFFDIERILRAKKPKAFILENVEGLVTHDREDRLSPIGRTLATILHALEELGYHVTWQVFDASKFGLPQKRRRIYIVGSSNHAVDLDGFPETKTPLAEVLEGNATSDLTITNPLVDALLSHFKISELLGKQIKDKRGGDNNIHSWDLELKGATSPRQREVLNELLKQRRRKSWAKSKGISWSDGMPLTLDEIHSFYASISKEELFDSLEDLVRKGYLAFEAPKRHPESPKGYNIVVGKLSFAISNILDPADFTPTLVATDVTRLAVPDGTQGLRRLSVREGLRLFGFPDEYEMPKSVSYVEAFDLLGNSVTLNVVKMVSNRVLGVL